MLITLAMKAGTKSLLVMLCLSLCGAGAVVAYRPSGQNQLPKPIAIPVENRDNSPRIWIQV